MGGGRDPAPRGAAAGLLLLTLLAGALRLHDLDRTSLWLDEGFSVRLAVQEWADFWPVLLADVHPPLYHLLLAGWTSLFGTDEAALRSLSVVFGTLTVPLAYAIARLLAGWRVALGAALLLATSSLHMQFSTEVRMYALQILLLGAATWGVVRFGTAAGQPPAQRRGLAAFAAGGCWLPGRR